MSDDCRIVRVTLDPSIAPDAIVHVAGEARGLAMHPARWLAHRQEYIRVYCLPDALVKALDDVAPAITPHTPPTRPIAWE